MTDTRAVAIAALCAVALLAVVAPVAGAAAGGAADSARSDAPNATNDSSMGAEISAFMQSSASGADGAVEDGMFEAEYDERPDDRATLVESRTGDLQSDLADLRERRQELRENRDETSQVEYRARMSRLVSDVRSLERSVNRTEPLAEAAGVDTTALRTIRNDASELSGREVAELARQMAVVPDERPDRGPDGDRGNGEANGREKGPKDSPGNGSDDANAGNDRRNATNDDGDDDDGGGADRGGGTGGDDGPGNGRLVARADTLFTARGELSTEWILPLCSTCWATRTAGGSCGCSRGNPAT